MGQVILKQGRDKPVRQRHPWIFSGAIASIEGHAENGGISDIVTSGGAWLARGYINRRSQIQARILTWEENEAIDDAFWRRRLERAIAGRGAGPARLVHAESDGLPGLVVDRYGEWLVMQAMTLGIDRVKRTLAAILLDLTGARGVWERSDVDVRTREGLELATGLLAGEEPPETIEITEPALDGRPLRFLVDVRKGHKTGFYLDQAVNRRRAAAACAGADVLNLFSYSGSFAVHALAAGARRVVNVDSSAPALELARRQLELNGFAAGDADFIEGDVFAVLRRLRESDARFDAVIVDPPKLAGGAAQVDRAARAYKDLNLIAMQLLNPGGRLITFSCSGAISIDLFQKIVFGAALDAHRDALVIERLGQAPDHPVLLSFPESEYLKGLIARV